MTIRYWLVSVLALILAAGLVQPAGANHRGPGDQAAWEQRLLTIAPNSPDGARTMFELVADDPETGLAALQAVWPKITSPEIRLFVLNQALEHPRVLDILHLGITDPSLYVQNRALQALEAYSFESFAEDFSKYQEWRTRQAGRTLQEIVRDSCRAYMLSIDKAPDADRLQRLSILQRIAYGLGGTAHSRLRRQAMLEGGMPETAERWLKNPTTAWTAFAVLRNLRMDETYLRRVIVPLVDPKTDLTYRNQAISVLANPDNRWAADVLLKLFVQEYPDSPSENLGYAITQMGEPRVLPTLIAMIETDRSGDGQRVLGNILNLATGNMSGQLHDGPWWHDWWTRNAARFSPEVRNMSIPHVALRQRAAQPATVQGPEQRQIAGDIKRTYWLISPVPSFHPRLLPGVIQPPPAPGQNAGVKSTGEGDPAGLLVVLPPDGNGANAALYWQDVARNALKNRYYVAVAVAPRWADPQPVTWVTADSLQQVKEAKFTTEKFAAEIVKDVAATHPVDPTRIFLHGATESGPVVYATSLDATTPFKGFYVLASGFKSAALPPLARAKGRRYLIEHSTEDKVAPYVMAAAAQKILTDQGATVRLLPYKGLHGYVFTDPAADPIGEAIGWLDQSQK